MLRESTLPQSPLWHSPIPDSFILTSDFVLSPEERLSKQILYITMVQGITYTSANSFFNIKTRLPKFIFDVNKLNNLPVHETYIRKGVGRYLIVRIIS